MNYAKLNKFKFPVIAASFALAFVVGIFSFFYGIKRAAPETASGSAPTQTNQAVIVDNKIKGNRNSKIYHLRGCPNYDDLKETNIVWFRTKDEAVSAGFRKARNC